MSTGSGSAITSTVDSRRHRHKPRQTNYRWPARILFLLGFGGTYLFSPESIFKDSQSNTNEVLNLAGPRQAQAQGKPAEPLEVQARSQIDVILSKTKPTGSVVYGRADVKKLLDMLAEAKIAKTALPKTSVDYYKDLFNSVFKRPADKQDEPMPRAEFESAVKPLRAQLIASQAKKIGDKAKAKIIPVRVAQREEEKANTDQAKQSAQNLAVLVRQMGEQIKAEIARDIDTGRKIKNKPVMTGYSKSARQGISKMVDAELRAIQGAPSPARVDEAFTRLWKIQTTVGVLKDALTALEEWRATWENNKDVRLKYMPVYASVRKELDRAISANLLRETEKVTEGKKKVTKPVPLERRTSDAQRFALATLGKIFTAEKDVVTGQINADIKKTKRKFDSEEKRDAYVKGELEKRLSAGFKARVEGLAGLVEPASALWTFKLHATELQDTFMEERKNRETKLRALQDNVKALEKKVTDLRNAGNTADLPAAKDELEIARKKATDYGKAIAERDERRSTYLLRKAQDEFASSRVSEIPFGSGTIDLKDTMNKVFKRAMDIKDLDYARSYLLSAFTAAVSLHYTSQALENMLLSPPGLERTSERYLNARGAYENAVRVFLSEFGNPENPLTPHPEVSSDIALSALRAASSPYAVALENAYAHWRFIRFDSENEIEKQKWDIKRLRDAKAPKAKIAEANKKLNTLEANLSLIPDYPGLSTEMLHSMAGLRGRSPYPDDRMPWEWRAAMNLLDVGAAFNRKPRPEAHYFQADTAYIWNPQFWSSDGWANGGFAGGYLNHFLKNWKTDEARIRGMGYTYYPVLPIKPLTDAQAEFMGGYAEAKPGSLSDPAAAAAVRTKLLDMAVAGTGAADRMLSLLSESFQTRWAASAALRKRAETLAREGDPAAKKALLLYNRAQERVEMVIGKGALSGSKSGSGLLDAYRRNGRKGDMSDLSAAGAWANPVWAKHLLDGGITSLEDADREASGLKEPGREEPVAIRGVKTEISVSRSESRWYEGQMTGAITLSSGRALKAMLPRQAFGAVFYEKEPRQDTWYLLSNNYENHKVRTIMALTGGNAYVFLEYNKKENRWTFLDAAESLKNYGTSKATPQGVTRIEIPGAHTTRQAATAHGTSINVLGTINVKAMPQTAEVKQALDAVVFEWGGEQIIRDRKLSDTEKRVTIKVTLPPYNHKVAVGRALYDIYE